MLKIARSLLILPVMTLFITSYLYAGGLSSHFVEVKLDNIKPGKTYTAIHDVLLAGIKFGGASVVTYFHPDGSVGTAHQHFNVAHNQKKECPVCGGPIKRVVVRGRGSYYCPKCQK